VLITVSLSFGLLNLYMFLLLIIFVYAGLSSCSSVLSVVVMDLRSMGIAVFSGEVIPLYRRLGSMVAALGA
jgi:hypothetical protein